ncbi:unnamed protein product [Prunus armeniaca]
MLKPQRYPSMRLLLMRTSWDTRIARIMLLLVALSNMKMSNVVDAEAAEEQIADKAAMEEDNSQGGVADKVRPYAKEQAGEAVE